MPLMFRTIDGTLVSDNEFADMGLYESEENVENGTEHILPFTDYGSDVESACDLEDEEDLEIWNSEVCGLCSVAGGQFSSTFAPSICWVDGLNLER